MITRSSDNSYVEGDDFDDREFRRGVWRQTLTSVALVTVSASGRENVMACEWAMMVSHAPMCFTISVHPLNVECRTVASHRLGHTLFIGEAVWARYDPAESPLIFHGGKYFRVGPEVPKS